MADDLIPEIREADATGETARIYREIRTLWGVPNVTTIVRHVATVPGCLDWAWATLSPAMRCGDFQTAAAGLSPRPDTGPLPRIPRVALRAMGVDAAAAGQVRDVFAAYNRNNRPNLLFVACLKRLLAVGPGGPQYRPRQAGWTPPAPAGALVPMVQPEAMAPALLDLALTIGSWGFPAGTGFVPGVYRHLATWPAYLAHAGALLWPRLQSGEIRRVCETVIDAADAEAARLVAALPPPGPDHAPPTAEQAAALAPALAGITPKIPEMIVICRLLEDALPEAESE